VIRNLARRQLSELRVGKHRTTTAHLRALYPFMAEVGLGTDGVYLGDNVLTGGSGFWFDPFDAYRAGLVSNPNMIVVGEPGMGKSTAVKTFVHRTAGILDRWVAIADPKGEYIPLAAELGLEVVALHPGGSDRINPLDVEPGLDVREQSRVRSTMTAALLATVLGRELQPVEDAAIGWACEAVSRRDSTPTLGDVTDLLAAPTNEMTERARCGERELADKLDAARYGLGKLLDRDLRGMFDGHSTVSIHNDRGVVIDLSSVHHDPRALAAVMVATTAWLGSIMRRPDTGPKIQVLDEAWALLAQESTSRYLQSSLKLGRAFGVSNLLVLHRLSDLRAQADDGTAASKIAGGLLADAQTRVLFRQSSDQIDEARTMLGLNGKEAQLLGKLCRGRAIWKVGDRTAVVAHQVASGEVGFCDTDTRMVTS
jgi:type IV secretory pathway VirB4 component